MAFKCMKVHTFLYEGPEMSLADNNEKDEELRGQRSEIHLLREELSGLREMLEGLCTALAGAQSAYGAVAQRADLLEKRIESGGRSKFTRRLEEK